ncbi:Fic family protein [Streptomyces griseofuscus]|uniref:Fic family protein n=1 Tax=Streptomyces griseofuscus TaxID=146922 RepID=UPI0012B8116F
MVRDDLRTWLRVRQEVDWGDVREVTGPIRGRRDGILAAAALRDKPGETTRGDGLRAAWRQARTDAAAGEALGFRLLQEWQKLVLGLPEVPFRTLPAFAKEGRERYGLSAETPLLFDACLAESGTPHLSLTARAARLYLDVCFFHPFDDGNGRAALLALGFVLAREQILLDEVGPIQIRRYADDPVGALSLARIVRALAVATERRGQLSVGRPAMTEARRACRAAPGCFDPEAISRTHERIYSGMVNYRG